MNKSPDQKTKPRASLRRGAGQGAVRLLRFATALQVTPLPPLRLRRLVWPKGSLPARHHGPNAPVWGAMLPNAIK